MTTAYIGSVPAARPLMENFDDRELGERAHFLFEYDPETGALISRFTRNLATYRIGAGHNLIRVDGRSFSAAVIVWLMHYFARPGKKVLKRIDKDPGNHRIENLICGHSEVVHGSQYMPKVVLPGRMPIWLEPCPLQGMAEAAIAQYVKEHRGDPIPACEPPSEVLQELVRMGCPHRRYAPGESRLNPYLQSTFGVTVRQDVDDLV